MRFASESGVSASTRDLRLARTLGAISSSRCQISRGGEKPISRSMAAKRMLPGRTQTRWWSQTGSNRRPPACKAGALPTELWPLARTRKAENQNANGRRHNGAVASLSTFRFSAVSGFRLVGLGRFELPTSRLSSARSNQLSYKPPAGREADHA